MIALVFLFCPQLTLTCFIKTDHLLELMAGPFVHDLSDSIDLSFKGSGPAWNKQKERRGWNKSPTTLFVALVLRLFQILEANVPEERLKDMTVNPFATRNLAAHLGQYYTSRGSRNNPSIVFYTMPSSQRHWHIAVPVSIIPIFGSLLNNTPPSKRRRIEGSLPLLSRKNRGRDEFQLLFATSRECFKDSKGGSKVNIIDILIVRMAWLKITNIAHENEQAGVHPPRDFRKNVATALVAHHDPLVNFFDSYTKFNDKWSKWRKDGIKIECMLQYPLKEWGESSGLSKSFTEILGKAVDKREWEEYRRRLNIRNLHDGGTKILSPSISVLQEGIMGDETMTHGERLKEFGRTGNITSDLFDFLVQLRKKWVDLRDAYYAETSDTQQRQDIVTQIMDLISKHSPVAQEWNVAKLKGLVLERTSCRGIK
jgi:hypothetical protein